MMADCSQLRVVPTSPTLPAKSLEGTALRARNKDIERRISAIAPVCARLDGYDSQAKAFESSYSGSLVRAEIISQKTKLLDLMRALLDLRKDNDLTMKSILQQYNIIGRDIEKKTEETHLECSGPSVPDMQATITELQSMKEPISIFIDVLVIFDKLADELNKIDMEGSAGAPGDTSIPSCRPEIAPLSAMLNLQNDFMKILRNSVIETEASSAVTLGDAMTAVASPMKSPTCRDTAKTIPSHTNGVDESKVEPEGWVSVCTDNN